MINKDASQEVIEKYKNNLKNIELALKMRGIKYKLIEGGLMFDFGKDVIYRYTYSLTKRKWRREVVDVVIGTGLTDLLADIDTKK